MYYITNQNDQIIAASADLLKLMQAESIDALYKQIALNAVEFTDKGNGITIKTPLDEMHYPAEKEALSSILGNMTLVRLLTETSAQSTEEVSAPSAQEEEKDTFSLLEDDDVLFGIKEEPEEKEEEDIRFALEPEEQEEDLSFLKPEEETAIAKEEKEDDIFDLILPSHAEESLGDIGEEKASAKSAAPVYIDVEQISQSIGISPEDYNTFLTEYVDTALSLEDDLKSKDAGKRTAATHTLFHLSNVLRIPVITDIIEQLKYTEEEDIESSIQSFYDTLSRLTTSKLESTGEEHETPEEEQKSEGKEGEQAEGFGTIDLSDVKPIHFDFQVEEAANELSLPAELIEEFIHDFIKQAHEETDKMLAAYEKGDMDTIQKIGHLLKGTASNLRINPLADTLYEIQFCDDSSKLEKLIKEYWAHFISFEKQFELTSQQKGN